MLQKLLHAVFVVFLFTLIALLLPGVVATLQEQLLSYQPRHLFFAKQCSFIIEQCQKIGRSVSQLLYGASHLRVFLSNEIP